jgi:hypothetical protein
LKLTHARLFVEQGENITNIQTQLGHSSPNVTLKVCARLMKPVNQKAALKLERSNFGSGHNLVTTKDKGATASTVTP